jgi:hypothetical protein
MTAYCEGVTGIARDAVKPSFAHCECAPVLAWHIQEVRSLGDRGERDNELVAASMVDKCEREVRAHAFLTP